MMFCYAHYHFAVGDILLRHFVARVIGVKCGGGWRRVGSQATR